MSGQGAIKRRDLLGMMGRGGLAAVGASLLKPRRVRAYSLANDKIAIALIGCGGMGSHHLRNLIQRNDIQIAAVCDVYMPRNQEAAKLVGGKCAGYQDYRKIMERKDIDAIFVATPDHWHASMAVHGCLTGKDVYVEKPLTTTIHEGRRIVETARRYGRIVQVGIQQRSMEVYRKAMDVVHGGRLGEMVTARAWIGANWRGDAETPQNPPEGLDWDLWLGPAPWVEFSPQRFGSFRSFDDYAGGELTNWGPHLIDIVCWGLKKDRPLSIQALGGTYRDLSYTDHETVEVLYEFEGATVTWSQSFHQANAHKGYGTMFQGTQGKLTMDRESFVVEPGTLNIPETKQPGEFFITVKDHHDNFFSCMRTRELPRADCEIGHRATSVCLLGNIAIDCGRKLTWDGDAERFIGDEAANRHLYRPYRSPYHL